MTHRDGRPDSATLPNEYVLQVRLHRGEDEGHQSRRRHHHYLAPPHNLDDHSHHHRYRRHRSRPHPARPAAAPGPEGTGNTSTSKQDLMTYLSRPLPPLPPGAGGLAYTRPRPAPTRPAAPPHHPWEAATPFENPRAAPAPPGPRHRRHVSVSSSDGDAPARGRPRAPRPLTRRDHPRSAPVSPGLASHWSDDSLDGEEGKEAQRPRKKRGGGDGAVRRAVRRASESVAGAVRRVGSFASRGSSRSRSRRSSESRHESPALSSSSSAAASSHHRRRRHRRGSASDRTRNLLAAVRDRISGGARSSSHEDY